MKETEIAWCDSTFNPWWGCVKISPGCKHCYAETFSKRVGLKVWGADSDHRRFGDKHWNEPRKWNEAARKSGKPRRVFCASMADVFEGRPEDEADRQRLWRLIEETPALTWLLLTKRPENMIRFAPWGPWPRNVWAGCTVEDQQHADERIPHLLRVPAAVRFLSCEPLLGSVDLSRWMPTNQVHSDPRACDGGWCARCLVERDMRRSRPLAESLGWHGLHWVIVGGESGGGARPFDLAWARSIREQCTAAGVAYFFKQAGAFPVLNDDRLDLKDRKGGDLDEIREHAPSVCIREFPAITK